MVVILNQILNMRNNIIRLALISVLAMVLLSCGKENKSLNISGDWKLSSAANLGTGIVVKSSDDLEITVYVSFETDGTFVLYQKLGDGKFRMYNGKWQLSGNMLTGQYADNTKWGSGYAVTVEDNGSTLVMAPSESPESVLQYTKTAIPSSVTSEAIAGM